MKKIILLTACVCLFACSNVRDKELPANVADVGAVLTDETTKDLTAEEKILLSHFIQRMAIKQTTGQGGIPEGTTIGSAIKTQQEFEKTEQQLKEAANKVSSEIQ